MDTRTDRPKYCLICEQTVNDPVTGFTIRFHIVSGEKRCRLVLGLGFDFGHREFTFDENGMFNGSIRSAPSHLKAYVPPVAPSESD
jgi:hypothetical protein